MPFGLLTGRIFVYYTRALDDLVVRLLYSLVMSHRS